MLNGIGIWIWKLSSCEKGNVKAIVKKAAANGVGWLAIKSGDAYRNNQWTPAVAKDVIAQCHKAGIQVYTWNYSKPSTWPAEVQQITSCFEDEVDGHIIDAEQEWSGHQVDAERFMTSIRAKVGDDKFIAHAPFAMYQYHNDFPYAQFGKYVDAVMPQLYWTEEGLPIEHACDAMDKGFAALAKSNPESVKPIYPIGVTYGKGFQSVPGIFAIEDMARFIKRYRGCYPSLYSWDASFPEVFPKLKEMQAAGDLNQDPVEPDLIEGVEQLQAAVATIAKETAKSVSK